jgi:hypothetical protein
MTALPRVLVTGLAALLVAGWPAASLRASSLVPTTEAEDVRDALGICIGRVERIAAFRHPQSGGIFSRIVIRPTEAIKGRFPATVTVVQRGGTLGTEGETNGLAAELSVGDERLFFLTRHADGSLAILRGFAGVYGIRPDRKGKRFADAMKLRRFRQLAAAQPSGAVIGSTDDGNTGTVQAASGSPANATGLLNSGGIPNRFSGPDRGEELGYLVDTQALPAGITQTQAVDAVASALSAWSAVTGITFRFDGTTNFGVSARNVTTSDERIRIQMHDLFGEITDPNTLGVGGAAFNTVSTAFSTTGGGGGQVNGLEFHKSTRGYVVLEHTQASLQNPTTLAEVLCHEIGHVLGMAHSSENSSEPEALLNQAIMYYRAHADGRGATLGAYDPPIIQKAHPLLDTPPYSYDRIVRLVTAPSAITTPGINEIVLTGYDRQTASSALTLVTNGVTSGTAATFSFSGSTIRLTPAAYYSDNSVDPATTSFFALKWIRFSDGVNASPWTRVRATQLWADSQPATRDGLPDSWMVTYFGSATPSAANLSRIGDDRDGDGLTNLTEFLAGTNPTDRNSLLAVTAFDGTTLQWTASPYLLYLVESSTNLSTWSPFGNPVVPTTSTGQAAAAFVPSGTSRAFYRVRLAP